MAETTKAPDCSALSTDALVICCIATESKHLPYCFDQIMPVFIHSPTDRQIDW